MKTDVQSEKKWNRKWKKLLQLKVHFKKNIYLMKINSMLYKHRLIITCIFTCNCLLHLFLVFQALTNYVTFVPILLNHD